MGTIQLNDVKAGTYPGVAKEWGYNKANSSESEGIGIVFEVRIPNGIKNEDGTPQYDTAIMPKVLYTTEGAFQGTMRALAAMGAFANDATDEQKMAAVNELWHKRGALPGEVDLVVDIENSTYTDANGETKRRSGPRIQFVNEKGSGGQRVINEDVSEGDLMAAQNRLTAMFAKVKAKAANTNPPRAAGLGNGAKPTTPTATAKPASDDDIPF